MICYLIARLVQLLTNKATANVPSAEVDSFESHCRVLQSCTLCVLRISEVVEAVNQVCVGNPL